MRVIAAIQARMGSIRFPGKVMADLCGKPVLQHVIDQSKKLNVLDVVVLTSDKADNSPIIDLCINQLHVPIRLMYNDLECLYWYYIAAKSTRADYIIRICGDSPFIDPELANILIDKICPEYDYISYSISGVPAIMSLYGIFVEIFSVKKLNAIMEHVTVPFYTEFNKSLTPWAMDYYYKLSIDYQEDLERAETLMVMNGGEVPGWKKINRIMKKRPELQYYGDMSQRYKWQGAING